MGHFYMRQIDSLTLVFGMDFFSPVQPLLSVKLRVWRGKVAVRREGFNRGGYFS